MRQRSRRERIGLGWGAWLLTAVVVSSGCGDDDPSLPTSMASTRGAGVARPTISEPVSGGNGPFVASTTFDLAQVGYEQVEYFIAGTATAFTNLAELTEDGSWDVGPGTDTAAYKTRVLVYRPIDTRQFNGTVIVEWLNVSGGLDAAANWLMGHVQVVREGAAWVGVSAQAVGVEGGDPLLGIAVRPLKGEDPQRYGSLVHPGDSFSYDIFSQAAQAVRRPEPASHTMLPGFDVKAVMAVGESQSAFRLVTYINAVHPLAAIYDGFLVHSRGGGGVSAAPLAQAPLTPIAVPGPARTRTDLDTPVLTFQTESDLTTLQSVNARQPDSERFRLWEVPGTAHADAYTVAIGPTDLGNSADAARLLLTTMPVPGLTCAAAINSGPHHYVLNAALAALNRWVRDGVAAPMAARIELGPTLGIARDVHSNARGGIRTPQLDAPIATYLGDGRGSIVCLLFGRTIPFNEEKLAQLYPTHAAYVDAVAAAAESAVAAGFLVRADADLIKLAAQESDIGG